jgi:hypothetical protein
VIRFGLRLTLRGGREALTRLGIIVAAVALGVGLLLVTLAGINAVNSQNARYAWLETGAGPTSPASIGEGKAGAVDPAWWLLSADMFRGQVIGRVDVAATAQLSEALQPPGAEYFLVVVAGLVASLGIIASTMPLLERITGPETARNE